MQAREFMVGTWTYAKADFPLWVKWVVREDGTMDAYESHPIDDNWGSPKTCHWEILSDKYGLHFPRSRVARQASRASLGPSK